MNLTRREVLTAAAALSAAPAAHAKSISPALIANHDRAVDDLLHKQITDPNDAARGGYLSDYGLAPTASGGAVVSVLTAAFVCPQSRHHGSPALLKPIQMAAGFLERNQSPEGNISFYETNFNSAPDTAFVVHGVGTAACLAQRYQAPEILQALRPFLLSAGRGLVSGGVHTPNHRWVVSAALAQLHEVFPNPAYVRRIDQWLAEGIDIDSDGQYTERSMLVYNTIVDRALVVLAAKLKRPALLEPVRRNLDTLLYMLHADGEVVSEVSRRQDLFQVGNASRYWFPLNYMAAHDNNGQYRALARRYDETAELAALLEYPELLEPAVADAPLPDDYEKQFPAIGIARIRRGLLSATLLGNGSTRVLSMHHKGTVVNAVRMASAFFGKGQFAGTTVEKRDNGFRLEQSLEAPYYQPLDPPQTITPSTWMETRSARAKSQICRLHQTAMVTERKNGLAIRFRSAGTDRVPIAIEISLRPGGKLSGCEAIPGKADSYLCSGAGEYEVDNDRLKFGPGLASHRYVQIRGAEPKLPGTSVYLTGITPFDHTIEFSWG